MSQLTVDYANKCFFNLDLKMFKDVDFLISRGRSFHILGAAYANARSPKVIFVLWDGICNNRVSWKLQRLWECVSDLGFSSSVIYLGA